MRIVIENLNIKLLTTMNENEINVNKLATTTLKLEKRNEQY